MKDGLSRALAGFMLRTAATPLRGLWAVAYLLVTRAAVALATRQNRGASVYLKGSFAVGEPVYGISDVDLVVVMAGDTARPGAVQLNARERWKTLARRLPLLNTIVQHVWFYEQGDLEQSSRATCMTYGLASTDDGDDRSALMGPQSLDDHMGLQTHPALYGPSGEWKRLAGGDRLPREVVGDAQSRRVAAWLDLQYWWRHAFVACAEPARAHVPLMCVKLIAEPVRLQLWIERSERVATRKEALQRGIAEMPEERELFEIGLHIMNVLHKSSTPPLDYVIAGLIRQSQRIAQQVKVAAENAGYLDVKLTGADEILVTPSMREQVEQLRRSGMSAGTLSLADWRARAVPGVPDEVLMLVEPDPIGPSTLAGLAALKGDANLAVRCGDILLLPTTDAELGMLRAVQCEQTDPVSFALIEGSTVARFPELDGWSTIHCARRAVAEHATFLKADAQFSPPHGWVRYQPLPSESTVRSLGLLFTAARAALFLESILEGDPHLAVSASGIADGLIARDPGSAGIVYDALERLRTARVDEPSAKINIAGMFDLVRSLPAYGSASRLAMAAR